MDTRAKRRWGVGVVAGTTIAVLAFVAVVGVPWGGQDVSSSVTDGTLRRLEPGMTEDEVRAILGTPLVTEIEQQEEALIWKYSRPVPLVRWYPHVVLRFVRGELDEVFVKRKTFWGVDSELRYWMKTTGERWTSPGFSTVDW